MQYRVGTSGFSYDEWVGSFYPDDLPGAQRLAFYAARLPTVEINNTFHRMPRSPVLAGWAARVPHEFCFALKAPRRITHAAKTADPGDAVAELFRTSNALGEHLGPVLFQLPPWSHKDVARLHTLLAPVPPGRRVALEFRHPSWLDDEVFGVLRHANAALCAADFDDPSRRLPLIPTADFGYVRLRADAYTDAQLESWADTLASHQWRDIFVFFKHEAAGAAPVLAKRFLDITTPDSATRRAPQRAATPKKPVQRAKPAHPTQSDTQKRS